MSARKQPRQQPKSVAKKSESTPPKLMPSIIGSLLLAGLGVLIWLAFAGIGRGITADNIRGVARKVTNQDCHSKATWTDQACPNHQPGDYFPFWNALGATLFFILLVLAAVVLVRVIIKRGKAT